jgi:hypothetical protein
MQICTAKLLPYNQLFIDITWDFFLFLSLLVFNNSFIFFAHQFEYAFLFTILQGSKIKLRVTNGLILIYFLFFILIFLAT